MMDAEFLRRLKTHALEKVLVVTDKRIREHKESVKEYNAHRKLIVAELQTRYEFNKGKSDISGTS